MNNYPDSESELVQTPEVRVTPGEVLFELRKLKGLSQAQLGKRCGIKQTDVSAFETGRKKLGIVRIEKLAEALDVHPAVIAFPNWRPKEKQNVPNFEEAD